MAEVKWIKIVTDIFDDEKILIIESMPEADAIIVIWFKLLCLAGKQNNSGVFLLNDRLPFNDEMFAAIFRRNVATVRLALNVFENLGMIEIVNDTVTIPSWGKHQNLEKIESRKGYMREYMKEYRERQKLISSGEDPVNINVNTNVNANEADSKPDVSRPEEEVEEDKDLDTDKDLEKEGDLDTDIEYSAAAADGNPYKKDNVIRYAVDNLKSVSPRAMEELDKYTEDLPEDVIKYAIDTAVDCGAPTYSYTKSILNRYIEEGLKTVGAVKAAEAERKNKKAKGGGTDDNRSKFGREVRRSYEGETIL